MPNTPEQDLRQKIHDLGGFCNNDKCPASCVMELNSIMAEIKKYNKSILTASNREAEKKGKLEVDGVTFEQLDRFVADSNRELLERVEQAIPEKYDIQAMYEIKDEHTAVKLPAKGKDAQDFVTRMAAHIGFNEGIDKVKAELNKLRGGE